MTEPPSHPLVKDLYSYNAQSNHLDLVSAEARYAHMIERKERLVERATFGLIALNGASVVAVFSALNGADKILADLSVKNSDLAFSIAAFLLGMMFAVLSTWFDTNKLTDLASEQFVRVATLRRISSTLHDRMSEPSQQRLGREIEELPSVLQKDFEISHAALWLLNGAGSAWLAGIALLMWRIGQAIDWGIG